MKNRAKNSHKKTPVRKKISSIISFGKETRWWKAFQKHSDFYWHVLIGALFLAVSTYLVIPRGLPDLSSMKTGDIAGRSYRATSDILIQDKEATMRRIEEVTRQARPVYDMDVEASEGIRSALDTVFQEGRDLFGDDRDLEINEEERDHSGADKKTEEPENIERMRQSFKKSFGVDVRAEVIDSLLKDRFSGETEEILGRLLGGVLDKGVISNKALLRQVENGITIRYLNLDREEVMPDPMKLIDTTQAEEIMERQAAEYFPSSPLRKAGLNLVSLILRPNLTFNKTETEARLTEMKNNVSAVFIQVKAGEVIVRDGEKITHEQIMKLRQIFAEDSRNRKLNRFIGYLIMNTLMMFLVWIFLSGYHPAVLRNRTDVVLLLTLFFLIMLISRITFEMAKPVITTFPALEVDSLYYGLPVAFAPWLAAMLVSTPAAFIMAIFASFYANIIIGGGMTYIVIFLVSSLMATYLGAKCRQRATFFRIGLFIGILNAGLVLSQQLTRPEFLAVDTLQSFLFGFSSGPAAALLVTGALPVMEHLFKKTTDIKLLELSNPAQPLLKRMVMEAPGTYHHSIMVGNLAEAAAESIGARPVLARIASYYHDIGKIKKPDYFIENNRDGRSRHDMLSPRMSSLILISHVKDGLELGREYNLPEVIIDAVKQHHGTSLITFFYQKAKEQHKPSLGVIKESEFRYPGTKPQTKENAIIMLADQVEAACRALPDPTPSKIKGMVQRIINNIYMDGQLNECNLTLKDVEIIQQQFTHVLVGTYHQRLDYPEVVNGKLREEAFGNKKSSKERKNRSTVN